MWKKEMKRATVLVLALFMITAGASAQKKKPGLDGKVYDVQLKDETKKDAKPITDEISFSSGKVKSTYLTEKGGFASAKVKISDDSTYFDEDVKQDIIKLSFEAEGESSDNKKFILYWTGTVDGEDITGTLVWGAGGDKVKKSYSYSGSLRGKKKKK